LLLPVIQIISRMSTDYGPMHEDGENHLNLPTTTQFD